MASIDAGSGSERRKTVSGEVPLVPFIDLLLCCVMFLLVTAVWNQIARLDARGAGGTRTLDLPSEEPPRRWVLSIHHDGMTLASTAGDRSDLPSGDAGPDLVGLSERLAGIHALEPNLSAIEVDAEDGVDYATVVSVLDRVIAEGFRDFTLGASAMR